jgi:hypothetical protein
MTAAAVVLALGLTVLGPGCGAGTPDVDKAAQYTPESLAQELAFRYRALRPETKKASTRSRSRSRPTRTIADMEKAEKLQKKAAGIATTKKRSGPATLDELLDDIEDKLDLIKGTSRSDACRQMVETLSKDRSLAESDKKLLSEKLNEMGGAS